MWSFEKKYMKIFKPESSDSSLLVYSGPLASLSLGTNVGRSDPLARSGSEIFLFYYKTWYTYITDKFFISIFTLLYV